MAKGARVTEFERRNDNDAETQAGRAYRLIRSEIIRGRLQPNIRLPLEELRSRYDLGLSPIREALLKLQAEGLVIQEDMKGFRVSPVSIDHLRDLTQMRIELETLGLRWSIERGDLDWEANIVSAFHRLSRQSKTEATQSSGINPSWSVAHRQFHKALIGACESVLLLSMCDALTDQAERYVAISIRYVGMPRDDNAEHEELMKAVLDRDSARAGELCAEHILTTTNKVIASCDILDEAGQISRARAENGTDAISA